MRTPTYIHRERYCSILPVYSRREKQVSGHIFISYSQRDSAYAKELVAHLTAAGIPVWIDQNLQPGTPVWVRTVEAGD